MLLVDRTNHHVFQPLLYQVATATLSPADICAPIRWLLRHQANADVLLSEVVSIDPAMRVATCIDGKELNYDFLIVASGARHSYFGHPEWEAVAPGLKSVEDAIELRRRWLLAFERAECGDRSPTERDAEMTFVIVGGGPTGVELAGMLPTIAKHALPKDFRHIDTARRGSFSSRAVHAFCRRSLRTSRRVPSARPHRAWRRGSHEDDRDQRRRRFRRDRDGTDRRRARSSGRPAMRPRRSAHQLGAPRRSRWDASW